jgi:hypothetical protein
LLYAESSNLVSDAEPQSGTTAKAELRPKQINPGQKHIIRGVYHLINQNDLGAAESEFRQAIALDQHNDEAYYFLGRVYYEQATSKVDISASQLKQSIGKAKALFLRAQELGITYDNLHPDLLSRLEQEYPKAAPIYEEQFFPQKAKIIIEIKEPSSGIRVLKINEQDSTTNESVNESSLVGTFQPTAGGTPAKAEIQLESGASYQVEFPPLKSKSIKHLILIGIGLAIWLIR